MTDNYVILAAIQTFTLRIIGVCTLRPPCAKLVCAVGSDGHVTNVGVVDWLSTCQRPVL